MVNPIGKLVHALKPGGGGGNSNSDSPRSSSESRKSSPSSLIGHLNGHRKSVSDAPSPKEEKLAKRQDERSHEQLVERLDDLKRRHAEEPLLEMRRRFGMLAMEDTTSLDDKECARVHFQDLTPNDADRAVFFEARVHAVRRMSAKLVFLVLRQQIHTLQAVLKLSDRVSEHFVRWAEHVPVESVVLCKGHLRHPQEAVQATSIHHLEIIVDSLHIVAAPTKQLPFTVQQASMPRIDEEERTISDRTLLASRLVDLRTPTAQAIFRIQSGVCNLFRTALDAQDFIEIHTPKLQGGATESGSSVFSVSYFGRKAFLAQSPQLAKQMCISADFGKV
jgi:aspartyl-tRNA synthetase